MDGRKGKKDILKTTESCFYHYVLEACRLVEKRKKEKMVALNKRKDNEDY